MYVDAITTPSAHTIAIADRKTPDQQLLEDRKLRAEVSASMQLPDLDLAGMRPAAIGRLVEELLQIEAVTSRAAMRDPFAERRPDSPGTYWLRQPGVVVDLIAKWAEAQLYRAQQHLEELTPIDYDEADERTMLLLARYARFGEFGKAVSLLAAEPVFADTSGNRRAA